MADDVNEEGKAYALKRYRIMVGLHGMLAGVMLICAIIATAIDEGILGFPYYVGGYLVGIMALITSLVCRRVVTTAPDANSDAQKQELRCALIGHWTLSIFMLIGCFIGIPIVVLNGFVSSGSSANKAMEVIILLGCIFGMFLTIDSCRINTYGRYFGVEIRQEQTGRMMIISTNATGETQFGVMGTNQSFQTNPDMGATNAQISQLVHQNQLLQQQLDLQRQLYEQQHQQQQYGGGFSQPLPPPMYNSSPDYPPTEPPPSYDDVK